jgi:CRISPR/Cas system-associated exonuclease Cas4 (RecB family)
MEAHMTAIPEAVHSIESLIYQSYQDNADPPRPHMGISQIGEKCDRKLWLGFRNVVSSKFPGRILKLFKFGHDYEDTVIKELKAIGCRIVHRQAKIDFGSHVSGSCDGIITNVPGREKQTLLLEIKTLSDKSFNDLKKKKLQESKPIYWAQVHCYMLGLKLDRCLFYALNKNTSDIYTEIVKLDKEFAEKTVERAKRIALSDYIPEPISADPSWFECKLCSYHAFCHETHITDNVSCRNCAHSTSTEQSQFLCARNDNAEIPFEFQLKGCSQHVLHPDLVPWKRLPADNPHEALYLIDNVPVRNGEADTNVYSSAELLANPEACAHADAAVEELRSVFDARITE